ncbi:hypothetical protein WR25_05169 [Diploscapter pachys]|uniref:Receptor L-domain domain-containing protein n=1 Tax=Diploscapter pachys TaxID=2018661 RepID=A0A2A2JZV0_9BILA|nr:hypothetical protein WR25_05169 [Diploscapter pachys]
MLEKASEILNLEDGCTEIVGNVRIENITRQFYTPEVLEQKFSSVTKIVGLVYVLNTELTAITFLRNLEIIEFNLDGSQNTSQLLSPFIVAANLKAQSFDLNKFAKIVYAPSILYPILIHTNSFCIEESLYIQLLENFSIIGQTDVCKPSKKYCTTSFPPSDRPIFTELSLPSDCQVLVASIVLHGSNATDAINDKLKNVEVIYGTIIISQTEITKLELPNLSRIVNPYGLFKQERNYFYPDRILVRLKAINN